MSKILSPRSSRVLAGCTATPTPAPVDDKSATTAARRRARERRGTTRQRHDGRRA